MHQDNRELGGVSSPDYDSALCAQQTVLLNRIDVLTRDTAIHNPPKSGDISTLKQEYNSLVKKRAKLVRSPLSDPMEVLPPDLWPDIIRDIFDDFLYPLHVDKLLDLTSVSKGWCSVLTTLPVIWTQIDLDSHVPDYLAKAMTCIQLSGECNIDLYIWKLTADEWRGISSMIVPEGRRIRRLSIGTYDQFYMVSRQILGDFTILPVLQELSLPQRPSQLSDQQYIYTLLTERMTSIKTVSTPECTIQDQIWNPYIKYGSLEAESLTKEDVEKLMLVPHLHRLTFNETAQTLESIPSLLKSSFGSVRVFAYDGVDICRRLTWIGNNLSTLSTDYPENEDANALLATLSRFPHLHMLTITVSSTNWPQPTQNKGRTASPHNSIRVLRLQCYILDGADWNVFFSIFFPASPCLENLIVRSGIITDMGWNSIQSITSLRDLDIYFCGIDNSSPIPLNMESLQYCGLHLDSHGLAQLIARLESKFLRTLRLTEMGSYPLVATTPYIAGDGSSPHTVAATPYVVAGAAFPNITSLVISNESSTTWELRGLYKLRELKLKAPAGRSHIVINILEAILMRPRDNPALEKITLTCNFVEWDILILMLERRNFLNEPGISSIKTLVFNRDLPYRLLYPLSELLSGRFVERDSNYSFSLEVVGERMWNKSLPGCLMCHYSLWECESLLIPRDEMQLEGVTGDDKEYPLANESLVADPPLPLEMKIWLSGRRERLTNFMRRYDETGSRSHRLMWCDASKPRQGGSTVTGDALFGAHFVRDLPGHDAGVDP